MRSAEILVGLLGAVTVLAGAARRVGVPSPIVLVVCGLAVGLVPGLPSVELDPDLVFFVFLPPLIYGAGFNSSPRDLRQQARRIGVLAIGLVAASTVAVAVVVKLAVPGFGWAEAFVLGAVLAPTDPVAAVAIMQRLRVAPQLSAVIEGESLVNDGTGLVLYRLAVGAAVSGTFSVLDGAWQLVATGAGGVAIGLAVGYLINRVRGRIDDAPIEITLSLFTPYAAYIAAEAIGASGILAAVTVGLYLGARSEGLFSATARIEAQGFWNALTFILESTLFLLMGLQIRDVASGIEDLDAGRVTLTVAITLAVVLGLRVIWMFSVGPFLRRLIPGEPKEEPPELSSGERLVAGWAGMRGAVSLAAALAIPATVDGGAPFPQRELIVFTVFSVIVLGLLLQGLTLPALIKATGLGRDEADDAADEARARGAAAEAALARLDEMRRDPADDDRATEHLRELYEARLEHARAPQDERGDPDREHVEAFERLREELLRSERAALHELHARGEISEEALKTVERDLDLQEARLD
ncbi:Sodium, potassium, lithium and rubidium/H(+) antiporter [Baekduia alba]|uniref:Na+/H+ antiporter n=1 Tax=Baekduia alba TaxID=2997333 RepID=UPI00234219E4|nr:Na+/H+ antiporter [Baekduia alba]WCB91705.1 Sodium, potassium, lithium and rubidium/H(+) antiporter [Baekduia alba]